LILLRPGCYVVHDIGIYLEAEKRFQQSSSVAKSLGLLKPALQVISYVQSKPEPNLVILGMGKRDVAIDCGFPKPGRILRPGPGPEKCWKKCPVDWEVVKVMDQHAFLKIPLGSEVRAGDMIASDISHPCNTFSAWKQLLVVDENYHVSDIYMTYF
jgi:D-serine dehydratase